MDKLEVGMICCWYREKSCGNFAHKISEALETKGVSVHILSSNCLCYRHNPFCDSLFLSHCKKIKFADFYWEPHPKYVNYLRMAPRLVGDVLKGRQFISEMKFPVLNYQQTQGSFGFLPLLSFLTFPTNSKRVITIHEIDVIQSRLNLRYLKLNTTYLNKIYNKADMLIVFTKAMKSTLENLGVRSDKISVIPHGTVIPELSGFDRDQIIFCGGHNIFKGKGFETFLRALFILKSENIHFKIAIYGLNSEYNQEEGITLLSKFGLNDQVKWFDYGFNDEVLNADLQKSMMTIIPHTTSEAGFQVTSAMANGVPVIATTNAGLPEYLGQSGFYIREDDVLDLVQKMKLLLFDKELRSRIGSQLRMHALKNFSWDVIAHNTHDLYMKVLHGSVEEPRDRELSIGNQDSDF